MRAIVGSGEDAGAVSVPSGPRAQAVPQGMGAAGDALGEVPGDGDKAGPARAGRMLLVLKGTWSDGSWLK